MTANPRELNQKKSTQRLRYPVKRPFQRQHPCAFVHLFSILTEVDTWCHTHKSHCKKSDISDNGHLFCLASWISWIFHFRFFSWSHQFPSACGPLHFPSTGGSNDLMAGSSSLALRPCRGQMRRSSCWVLFPLGQSNILHGKSMKIHENPLHWMNVSWKINQPARMQPRKTLLRNNIFQQSCTFFPYQCRLWSVEWGGVQRVECEE